MRAATPGVPGIGSGEWRRILFCQFGRIFEKFARVNGIISRGMEC